MTRYNKFQRPEFKRPPIHPIWRGIGLIILLLIPIISWFGAESLVDEGMKRGWAFVVPLAGRLILPADVYYMPGMATIGRYLANQPNMGAKLIFFVLIAISFFGLISLIYAIAYRFIGPPQYLPIDAPPPKVKVKSYKR